MNPLIGRVVRYKPDLDEKVPREEGIVCAVTFSTAVNDGPGLVSDSWMLLVLKPDGFLESWYATDVQVF